MCTTFDRAHVMWIVYTAITLNVEKKRPFLLLPYPCTRAYSSEMTITARNKLHRQSTCLHISTWFAMKDFNIYVRVLDPQLVNVFSGGMEWYAFCIRHDELMRKWEFSCAIVLTREWFSLGRLSTLQQDHTIQQLARQSWYVRQRRLSDPCGIVRNTSSFRL